MWCAMSASGWSKWGLELCGLVTRVVPIWIFIYLFTYLFIFFGGGGQLGSCLHCAGVYIWLCVSNIPTLVLCFFACHQFCFNLEIWCFVVFSRVAGYVYAWLHCFHGSSHLSFTFFCGAGVLPHYFNYPRTDYNLTSILFVYHVILLVVVIL